MEINVFRVCVECITFNHAPYIVDCMNGFTMQQTTFPYVCCILDDASTDGEPEIMRKYVIENFNIDDPSVARKEETDDYVLWFAQHKINKNCFFAVFFLKYNHYSKKKNKMLYMGEWRRNSKYAAMCEGDDYWTDPLKLQKQLDFMETHVECTLCFHPHYNLLPSNEIHIQKPRVIKHFYNAEDIISSKGGFMATNTMFFLGNIVEYDKRPDFWKNCPVGDAPIKLLLLSKGLAGYIDEEMSVHRVLVSGSWTSRQQNIKNRRKHHVAILKMYDEFDAYTEYKYHKVIMKKKRDNRKVMIRKEFASFIKRFLNTIKGNR